MTISDALTRVPQDSEIFGMDFFEIRNVTREVLQEISRIRGHFSVKVDPLSNKQLLHDYGFYYCDTLIEPCCKAVNFIPHAHDHLSITQDVVLEDLTGISRGTFLHGRFHRDFNLDVKRSDLRYERFIHESYAEKAFVAFLYNGVVAGFLCYRGSKLILHALTEEYRGRGLSKYFWTLACRKLFAEGYPELTSSVSAANMPVLNLYASLGFRFRNPLDVYHRITP